MKKIDLVILVGGKGSRIKRFLANKPKPMMVFNDIYFLQYLLNIFTKHSIFDKIFLLTGYKYRIIFNKFHNKMINLSKVECLREKKPMGTGGALLSLKKKKINDFVLTNGDTIFDINLPKFLKKCKNNKLGCVALTSNKKNTNNFKLNNLTLEKNVLKFKKKGNLMNGGIYFFKKKIINFIPKRKFSLEDELLPILINKGLLNGETFNDFFLDIGSPKYLKVSEKRIKKYFYKPAAFLDRDGVINYDYGYVHKKKDFKFKKGVIKGLQYLTKKNYHIFLVTNQAGIAKGIFKENDFIKFQSYINERLNNKNIFINDVQFCPYHPQAKLLTYKKNSNLRKPGNQMIKNIFKKYLINKDKSFMIGDNISDETCARRSKLRFYYTERNFENLIRKIVK